MVVVFPSSVKLEVVDAFLGLTRTRLALVYFPATSTLRSMEELGGPTTKLIHVRSHSAILKGTARKVVLPSLKLSLILTAATSEAECIHATDHGCVIYQNTCPRQMHVTSSGGKHLRFYAHVPKPGALDKVTPPSITSRTGRVTTSTRQLRPIANDVVTPPTWGRGSDVSVWWRGRCFDSRISGSHGNSITG